ncbi:hypothetical protein X777_06596 [Ooceraea biroi]|uniref:THAP domain-containing protein n=1 Tax=Ooceraea biroi TaxID=2015173 RepID=A0A026WD59_OOCBI|nr:hypothetical protein X777_06596 [Ooceraea biroi]
MSKFILEIIQATTSIGLNVRSICSDIGSNNKALWSSLGICVSRDQRIISFEEDSSNRHIYVLADIPHLLKNWKSAIQRSQIYLPMEVVQEHDLPTNVVTGKYINDLWNHEMRNKKHLRSLHHLIQEIVTPGHFSKMNVGNAMRYISIKTAGALETVVIQKIIPREALTTAWFLRFLRQWFELINSRRRVASVTRTNVQNKKTFMDYFVSVVE